MSVGFLIKCKRKDLEDSVFKYTIDKERSPDGEFIYVYISNEQGPDYSNPPPHTHGRTPLSHPSVPHRSTDTISETPLSRKTVSKTISPTKGKNASLIITLSDSESDNDVIAIDLDYSDASDDADLLRPLSERIRLSNKSTTSEIPSKGLHAVPPTLTSSTPKSVATNRDGTTSVRTEKSCTPAHKAGMVAIQRMKNQDATPKSQQAQKSTTVVSCKEATKKNQKTVLQLREIEQTSSSHALVVDLTDSNSSTDDVIATNSSPKATQAVGVDPPVVSKTCVRTTVEKSLEELELGTPEFVLKPGDFEVILCVDSAESTASRKHTSQFRGLLLQELAKNGVQFDVRKLNVGDFLWVGRERVCPVPGQLSLPSSREVVLEYIVERKRMDDLAGSITDGRFKEQKFRLKSCGVSHPVYLVEEYRDMTHLSLPLRTLNQSIANTQVIDHFYVKRTKDIRESIAYLTIMTRQLQTHYTDKTLEAYPHETISELIRAGHSQCVGSTVHSMPFKTFNEASIKNKVLSVYEMFGRQLMQLPGVSADKAVAVLQLYPTVSSLRHAYSECSNVGEQVKLLSNIKAGKTKRRLGESSSSLIYSLYWLGKDP